MSLHPDFEDLSAFVDGQAPEWSSHVAACGPCQATVEQLRAVQAAVVVPVEQVAAGERERAIAAAVTGSPGAGPDRRPERARRPHAAPRDVAAPVGRPSRWLVPASVAALFLLVVGAASMLMRTGPSDDQTATAGRVLESTPEAGGRSSADAGALADSGAAATATSGSLGEIADAATLLARARPGLTAKVAPVMGPAATVASAPGGQSGAVPAPNTVGTRPCEEQARTREPALREVVYFATATRQAVAAFVLGFSTGPPPAPVTLLMLAQDGCAVLLRAAGP